MTNAPVNRSHVGPTGPDEYGCYAHDIGDTIYDAAPVYDWFDIAPPGPGNLITEITDSDAAIMTFSSLFSMKYYGGSESEISVNSNGFLTMEHSDYLYGGNSPIPDAHGPVKMIAPFWDDLDPSAGGDIHRWLDTTHHRWIIQFDEVRHWGSTDTETFQVIILNEGWYPTPTGDTPILIQYQDITDPSSCTIGIENAGQGDGIGWACDGAYGPQAPPIADETARQRGGRPTAHPRARVTAIAATKLTKRGERAMVYPPQTGCHSYHARDRASTWCHGAGLVSGHAPGSEEVEEEHHERG
jgi:hypothetical protein